MSVSDTLSLLLLSVSLADECDRVGVTFDFVYELVGVEGHTPGKLGRAMTQG